MTKEEARKKYILEHGRCCDTCNNEPTNHGQRDSCVHTWMKPKYSKKNDYVFYRKATKIYSIDIPYCC